VVGYPPCSYTAHFKQFIEEKYKIPVVVGSHPIPQKYWLTHQKHGHGNLRNGRNSLHQRSVMKKPDFYTIDTMNKQCKWFPVCPMKFYWEQGKINELWIKQYCKGNWSSCIRYQKEEADIYHPDNMMPDGHTNKNLK
jgi:hypothetical protein